DIIPRPLYDLLIRILNQKKRTKFPNSLKCFAATLHFHSPAAYLFVRKEFLKCLPHQNTLRKWMQNINSNSGISTQTLKIISDVILNAQEKENKIVFNLTIDEMSIKQRIDWDGQKSYGFVDIGTRFVHGDVLPASKVLVFMLLLKTVLCALYEKNVDVVSITFDGASSNISICEELGARLKPIDIEDIVPYFAHPNNEHKRISIFYDACHMVKLVRNAIDKYNLNDKDSRTISWKYIKQLVFLQDAEKLYPAVKIGHRHINFNNEKMKVSLAVQVLSTSVCDALKFLEYPQFAAASGTAIFCKMLNDIFDLLNSKSLYAKTEIKKAITRDNLLILKDEINEFISYIKSLKIQDTFLLQSIRKTFIRLIIDLQNSIAVAEKLFNESTIEFLLTYKLSQDHIETWFALIRRMNGYNNNPSAKQFQSSFRKILFTKNMSVPSRANCTP
ncbi:THAP domain-containing protein 9, partial [Trachymyrmex cornetzi]